MIPIRDAALPDDLAWLLSLNNAEAEAVNALSPEGFAALAGAAFALLAAGEEGFLLALDHAAPPQGPNHSWFLARGGPFAYVDRVVVAPEAQGDRKSVV